MTQAKQDSPSDLEKIRGSVTVSVKVASRVLGIGLSTAHRAALRTGEIVPGVPVVRPSQRKVRVLTEPLLAFLQLNRSDG